MLKIQAQLNEAGVGIAVVAQAKPEQLTWWLSRRPQPVPFVSDPDRSVYKAFELGRVTVLHFFRPVQLLKYMYFMFRQRLRLPIQGEDMLQLGGDFILDRSGNIVFAHPSRAATDRPSKKRLLAAVRKLVQK